ncbi:MAG: hypothetical protein QM723_15395 [Myxococcaceae bacterium]
MSSLRSTVILVFGCAALYSWPISKVRSSLASSTTRISVSKSSNTDLGIRSSTHLSVFSA